MPGKHITKKQVELYMTYKNEKGLSQEVAAAKTGMSTRTARTIDHKQHLTQKPKKVKEYKTRISPLDAVWESELIPMLEQNPSLQPKTLFLHLERKHQDEQGNPIYKESILRTLQRRVSVWKAIKGPNKEVMFPQTHHPGQQGLSDFTHFHQSDIYISGKHFKHMFYHFRLVYSKWSFLKVISTGESFQALSEGLQAALFQLGGAPFEHRTDSLSAAFKNLSQSAKEDLTGQYEALCQHYQMQASRNNKGKSHENGSVESSHGHLKNRIAQELLLRGNTHFKDITEYETWIQNIVRAHNARHCKNFEVEKAHLKPLPPRKTSDYELKSIKVTRLSMLTIKSMHYSVPSSFCGHTLTCHIYQHKIHVYLGSTKVLELKREYQQARQSRYVIHYAHLIPALIKKPGAFRYCQYRDELLPNDIYRTIWQYIDNTEPKAASPKIMLRILKCAFQYDCETSLGKQLMELVKSKQKIDIDKIESHYRQNPTSYPAIKSEQHSLKDYDFFIKSPQITGEQDANP